MARCTGPAVRRRFYQLRVMDLLVRELSLEYEAALQARLPPPAGRLASAASAGSDFLSSPSRPAASQGGSCPVVHPCASSFSSHTHHSMVSPLSRWTAWSSTDFTASKACPAYLAGPTMFGWFPNELANILAAWFSVLCTVQAMQREGRAARS